MVIPIAQLSIGKISLDLLILFYCYSTIAMAHVVVAGFVNIVGDKLQTWLSLEMSLAQN